MHHYDYVLWDNTVRLYYIYHHKYSLSYHDYDIYNHWATTDRPPASRSANVYLHTSIAETHRRY